MSLAGTGYIALGMIGPSAALAARYQRDAFRDLTYEQALARFAALWAEAVALRADLQGDWEIPFMLHNHCTHKRRAQ